jgi:hypothetical protein
MLSQEEAFGLQAAGYSGRVGNVRVVLRPQTQG